MFAWCSAHRDPPKPVAVLHMLPTGGAADPMTPGRLNSCWGHLWRPVPLLQDTRAGGSFWETSSEVVPSRQFWVVAISCLRDGVQKPGSLALPLRGQIKARASWSRGTSCHGPLQGDPWQSWQHICSPDASRNSVAPPLWSRPLAGRRQRGAGCPPAVWQGPCWRAKRREMEYAGVMALISVQYLEGTWLDLQRMNFMHGG